jgi:hypothetical protein
MTAESDRGSTRITYDVEVQVDGAWLVICRRLSTATAARSHYLQTRQTPKRIVEVRETRTVTSPGAPEAEHDSSLCPEEESRYMECSCPCEQCKHICTAGGES